MDHFAVFTRSRFWKYSGVSDRIGGRVCHYLTRNWLGKWQTSDFSLKPFKRPHKRTLIPQMRTPQLLKKFSALPRAEQPNPLELKFFLLYEWTTFSTQENSTNHGRKPIRRAWMEGSRTVQAQYLLSRELLLLEQSGSLWEQRMDNGAMRVHSETPSKVSYSNVNKPNIQEPELQFLKEWWKFHEIWGKSLQNVALDHKPREVTVPVSKVSRETVTHKYTNTVLQCYRTVHQSLMLLFLFFTKSIFNHNQQNTF